MYFRPYFYFALFLSIFMNTALLAQTTEWTARFGGSYWDEATDIALSPSNNRIFVCGMASDSLNWGNGNVLESNGSGDFWIASYDQNGAALWMQLGGGRVDDRFNALVLSPNADAVYAAGTIRDTVVLGSDSLKTEGLYADDPLLVKYNAETGNIIWQKHWRGVGLASATAIAADNAGNIYANISFRDTIYVQNDTLTALGSSDILLVKMNSEGVMQWYKQFGGIGADVLQDIQLATDGSIYVGGYFQQTAIWGATILTAVGESDIFMAHLNPNGEVLWAKREGNDYSESITSLVLADNNRVYWAGQFNGNTKIGEQIFSSNGTTNALIIATDTSGNVQWVQQGIGAINATNNISSDAQGNVYLCGSFSENLSFGNFSLTATGSREMFVVRYSANGEAQWIKGVASAQTNHFSDALAIQTNALGNCYIVGNFNGSLLTDNGNSISSQGFSDIFIAHIAPPLIISVEPIANNQQENYFNARYSYEQDAINIQFGSSEQTGSLQFVLSNLYGQILFSQTLASAPNDLQTLSLPVSKLSNGLYIVTMIAQNERKTSQKLFVSH